MYNVILPTSLSALSWHEVVFAMRHYFVTKSTSETPHADIHWTLTFTPFRCLDYFFWRINDDDNDDDDASNFLGDKISWRLTWLSTELTARCRMNWHTFNDRAYCGWPFTSRTEAETKLIASTQQHQSCFSLIVVGDDVIGDVVDDVICDVISSRSQFDAVVAVATFDVTALRRCRRRRQLLAPTGSTPPIRNNFISFSTSTYSINADSL